MPSPASEAKPGHFLLLLPAAGESQLPVREFSLLQALAVLRRALNAGPSIKGFQTAGAPR